jgi:hypothetical protein
MAQHPASGRQTVAGWGLEQYLDVLDSFLLISCIKSPNAPWGELVLKCSCKYCYVHTCCSDSLICSMILNPNLKIPGNYAVLEPANRKKRGLPTDKRVEQLQKSATDINARAFVDKAVPQV